MAPPLHPPPSSTPTASPAGLPDFLVQRNRLFDELKDKYDWVLAQLPRAPIMVTANLSADVDDKNATETVVATAWETTPGHLLRNAAKAVAAEAVVASVDGALWDLHRPLEKDCRVAFILAQDPEGRSVLWHSAAHVLGEAAEHEYGCLLSHGPPTTTGFFCDMALGGVNDAMGREFQYATIQLDFQLPHNFNLLYRTSEVRNPAQTKPEAEAKADEADSDLPAGMARPVMIHHTVISSFDCFLGVIIEHFAGRWPFWLSPRQVMVIPVMTAAEDYAREVQVLLHEAKVHVDVDVSGNTLQKKICNAQVAQYNFTIVVGADEIEKRAVNVRNRDDPASQQKGAMCDLQDLIERLETLKAERRLANAL